MLITKTQEERWMTRYNEVVSFIKTNYRNPSKYAPEEKLMVHFLKRGRKLMNAGELKEPRLGMFKELLELSEKFSKHPTPFLVFSELVRIFAPLNQK